MSPNNSSVLSPGNSVIMSPINSNALSPANSVIMSPSNSSVLSPEGSWSPQLVKISPRIKENLAQSELNLRRSQDLIKVYKQLSHDIRRSCDLRELHGRYSPYIAQSKILVHGIPLSPPPHLKTYSLPRLNHVKMQSFPESCPQVKVDTSLNAQNSKLCSSLPFISHKVNCTKNCTQRASPSQNIRAKRSVSCYIPYQNVIDNDYFTRSSSQTELSSSKPKCDAFYKTKSMICNLPLLGKSPGSSSSSKDSSTWSARGGSLKDTLLWRKSMRRVSYSIL